MPFYCYSLPDGRVEERFYRMGAAPTSIQLDSGQWAERDFAAEHRPRHAGGGWPLECFASGVPAGQAQELRDFYIKYGENVRVNSNGNPIYESAGQRKRALKLRGLVDFDSF